MPAAESARSESGPFPPRVFLNRRSLQPPIDVPRLSLAGLQGDRLMRREAQSALVVPASLSASQSTDVVAATFVELESFDNGAISEEDKESTTSSEGGDGDMTAPDGCDNYTFACDSVSIQKFQPPPKEHKEELLSSRTTLRTETNKFVASSVAGGENRREASGGGSDSCNLRPPPSWKRIVESMQNLQQEVSSYDACSNIDALIDSVDRGGPDVDHANVKSELQLLRGHVECLTSSIQNFLKTFELSQMELSRLEDLAVEQWHRLTQADTEKATLKSEVLSLRKERDDLLTHKFQAHPSQGDVSEYLNRIQQALEEKRAAEELTEQIREELLQRERMLIEAKMNLADEKTKCDLSNKLIRYYVKHLEVCDPEYIIPLVDRQRVEDLQIADISQDYIRQSTTKRLTTLDSTVGPLGGASSLAGHSSPNSGVGSRQTSLKLLKSFVNSPLFAMGLSTPSVSRSPSPERPSHTKHRLPPPERQRLSPPFPGSPSTTGSLDTTCLGASTLRISTYSLDEATVTVTARPTHHRPPKSPRRMPKRPDS
eukprot:Gregarina_sp_Pseudo_9__450@NODE_1290_length_1713_cov_3_160693_g1213_i0_p1_GENE_NODE_1290_length_1713_cov_3_160693_g1213_i0NODE_1290_length_1713_cov_3_160693_g1213_i0_p1_ORF_typecomplete_len552_score76_14WEMBL/PF05701_11/0_00079CCDC158/PF15921_5/2_9e03CCDC158/PF15921_5/0_0074CCDC158/PF15921_5/1_3e03AAA_23/PF13476_6/0_25Macoilin/PF09726_9/0_42Uso1_p115_C/PF04871_13/0_77Uso1_p115_C/PF04871_13/38L27_2/PF09045_10/5_1e03L27_2/PF09045_10/1_2e02L27_2/PF09045_10/4_4Sfi1/PF08457_10/1_2DUF445/PF04286_12/1_